MVTDVSIDAQFNEAVNAFKRRDPTKLAAFVITHDLTADQRVFIAKVLTGDEKPIDGRTDIQKTEQLVFYFDLFLACGLKASVAIKKLADLFDYEDTESLRKTLSRNTEKYADTFSGDKGVQKAIAAGLFKTDFPDSKKN